ncbi:MAG: TonB-dependent receptor [Pedobacter sp.]|uniref:SusC/RagA family TonB-linked outer membrane protein n=1 Tax=Pedobacter sp. TaxID=1411316 RepID=UPI003561A910
MKRTFYLKLFNSFFLCCFACLAFAQQRQVGGQVTDSKNMPVPGATISISDTKTSVQSDANGNFNILVPDGFQTLVIKYLGMDTKTVKLTSGQKTVKVVLDEASSALDEVVVVGYGTVKRRDLTGSVASIKGSDLLKTVPISINEALQGQLSGVEVQRNDGAPGAGISIQIRGANSFASSTEPLYVIDGIPFNAAATPVNEASEMNQTINPLATLNPEDIETIDILKDASSTAIYGSRGANGVVLITTKSGKAGEDKIEFSVNTSYNTIAKKIKLLDAYDYATFQNEAYANQNLYEGTNKQLPYRGEMMTDPATGGTYLNPAPIDFRNGYNGGGTNWQDKIFRNVMTSTYSLRVSGGNAKGTYAFSGNYVDQPGVIVGSGFKRIGTQINLNRKVHNWVEIGTNTNISRTTYNLSKTNADNFSSNVLNSALHYPSTLPVFDPALESGSSELDWFSANPFTYVSKAKDVTQSFGLYSSTYAKLNINEFLNFRQNVGFNINQNNRDIYYGRYLMEGKAPKNGIASKADDQWQGMTLESILTFNKSFQNKHNLNATGVFAYETGRYSGKSVTVKNFPNDILEDNDISAGLDRPVLKSRKGDNTLLSFLGRVMYNYSGKYFATASLRRDGSSKFAQKHKYGFFPSFDAAWLISEEEFIKNKSVISNLKLRASYGKTGNQSISSYQTLDRLSSTNAVVNGTLVSGFSNGNPTDPNLKWETTSASDIGLDLGLFQNRLTLTADVYYKKTENLLQNLLIPLSTGSSSYLTNYGTVTNKGLELAVNAAIFRERSFNWNVNANISFNRNKISGLNGDQFARRLWSGIDQVFIQRNDLPIGAILGYVEDGFYDNEAEVRADPAFANLGDPVIRSMIGERKYKNMDNDKTSISTTDRVIIGNTNPDYTFGITNNFQYKKFNLSIFIQGVQGKDIINSNLLSNKMAQTGNVTQESWDNRWTPDNFQNAKWPKANSSFDRRLYFSDKIIEDGSYVRLKNINFGYTFNNPFKGLASVNVYGNVSNLITITNYSWYDPDINSFASDPASRGVDLNAYPTSRTFTVGIKTIF